MTDKEKLDAIRAEIHRLVDVRGYDRGMANDLFAFINSLPNEPISNDLKGALKDYAYQVAYDLSHDWLKENATWNDVETAVKLGAQWQKEQLIDKACEWLNNFYSEDRHCYLVAEDIKAFKQAMEE